MTIRIEYVDGKSAVYLCSSYSLTESNCLSIIAVDPEMVSPNIYTNKIYIPLYSVKRFLVTDELNSTVYIG